MHIVYIQYTLSEVLNEVPTVCLSLKPLAKRTRKSTQVCKIRTCVRTCEGWPNGFASRLTSDECLGSCDVQYGGQYKSTDGSQQAECDGNIQSRNKIGFWCDYAGGDGAVLMIGGGGADCKRAAHGIGITEADEASFAHDAHQFSEGENEHDFGGSSWKHTPPSSYSLNLWVR